MKVLLITSRLYIVWMLFIFRLFLSWDVTTHPGTAACTGCNISPDSGINMLHWWTGCQGKTELLGENPSVPVPNCLPETPHALLWNAGPEQC